jgi:rhodanese-related sulfurtransferase
MSYDLSKIEDEVKAGTAKLLDVREQEEWDAGHLKNAELLQLSLITEGEIPESLDKSIKIYLHCRSGQRVHMAAPLLQQEGFGEVIPLSEGFESLLGEGFEEA